MRQYLSIMAESFDCTEVVQRLSKLFFATSADQKAVTFEAVNAMGEKVEMRICSTPTEQAADIYSMLNYKKMPSEESKSVEHSHHSENVQVAD